MVYHSYQTAEKPSGGSGPRGPGGFIRERRHVRRLREALPAKAFPAGTTEFSVANARPEEFYNVMVSSVNDVESLDALTHVTLGVAPKETILIIR